MSILIQHTKNNCKYHRGINEIYKTSELAPEGLCPHLYYIAYPYCLSLLYEADFSKMKDKDFIHAQCSGCPCNEECQFEVRRIPLTKEIERNGIKKNKEIIITILKSTCWYKAGEIFKFNQGDDLTRICPAAFYCMYPYLIKPIKEPIKIQCPDNVTKIEFVIKNV